MANDKDWKTKYFDSLRELESLERDWTKRDDLLRKAVSRLSITAKGINPRLDSLLTTLQAHCKQKKDDMLATDLDRLSQLLNTIDEPEEEYQWNEFAIDLARRFKAPTEQQTDLDQLKQQLPDLQAEQALTSIADVINRLLQLEQATGPDSVSAVDLLDELIERVTATFGSNEALEKIRGEVVEHEGECDWHGYLDRILQQLRSIVRDINNDRAQLETLIVDVSQQLKDISSLLHEEHEEHLQGRNETLRLQNAMDLSVSNMQQEIREGTDVEQMKAALDQNLSKIKTDLKDFVDSDNQRFQHAEQRNQSLQEQLNKMEGESAELRRQLSENRKKLMYDALTGVRSRMSYDELMDQEFARYARYQEVFSYALLDIDFFKKINDTFGHNAGDNALRIVASMMTKHIRKTDFLFRIGGEEFALLLPKTPVENAAPVVETIRKSVGDAEFHYKGERVNISMSAGLTEIHGDDEISTIYQRADKALYAAKNSGRDRMVVSKAV